MKLTFRATTPADLTDVCSLLQRVFAVGPDATFLQPNMLRWKYWDPRGDYSAPRSFVLEGDGGIVAHAGIWPMIFGSDDDSVRGCQMIDWAAAPDSPGAGLGILQKLAGEFDFIHAIGGTEMTRKVLPAFGFVESATVWRAARPLRPLQQILSHQYRNWKLVPRLARNALWSVSPKADISGWDAKEIAAGDVIDGLVSGNARENWFSPRTSAFFEFYLRCPSIKFSLHQVRNSHGPQGHFVLGVLHGQARLAGIWLENPTPETLLGTYASAQKVARRMGASEVAAGGSMGPSCEAAVRSGFRQLSCDPVFILNKTKRLVLPDNFQFQLWDDDEAFLDAGGAFHWT